MLYFASLVLTVKLLYKFGYFIKRRRKGKRNELREREKEKEKEKENRGIKEKKKKGRNGESNKKGRYTDINKYYFVLENCKLDYILLYSY